jgi:very-short-patch-repair endonuclease
VATVLERVPNAKGAAVLRAVMTGDIKVTLSKLEKRFLELLAQHGLPLPDTNKVTDGRRIDCGWPDHKLTVELDGWRFHNSRHSWEQGNERERQARRRGDRFRRFTYADVVEDPTYMLGELAKLLAP